jgi:hypothetical protein
MIPTGSFAGTGPLRLIGRERHDLVTLGTFDPVITHLNRAANVPRTSRAPKSSWLRELENISGSSGNEWVILGDYSGR